ncbi:MULTISPECIES: XkdF-like putative serine protease domain-containing protein [unclassified Bacillus (in: firmicutes)]|uniref:XkdF-like putative serine protease domain-containing protein n=1 Tax=unclassified Bacillus (in: firmicutes) TaxID=185979 RepID=UPI002280685F|nr:XkdF-like putative serine protease domain-containing protein [Bacillus sp. S20C3]MCY8290297.1 XkdF-like putative serine protease domain-containing protein [Bacillus sp. N13C7]MCY8637686.1 XkdF-like putative serine protease domain-containing protein [Bacillus sp. S17B2]MCY9144755.1 XkdF-like putative serine protease domain-containing protein [Bacillus sp. T9C1]
MPRELVNAKITHVSYVDKAANQKQFFFMKSEKQPDFQKEVKVLTKEADEQKLVYGIVYEPDTVDAHGDFMTAEEIEKAAHGFLKDAREIDKQHDFQGGVGAVVESYVAPADFEMNGETIKKGSWVLVTKASEEIWEEIKKGEITGYSMAGVADIAKQEEPVSPDEKGLFNFLKNFFAGNISLSKGAVQEKYDEGRKRREFWAAQDALNSALFKWDYSEGMETDPEKIREALQDFVDIAQEVLISKDILKAIGSKPEELQKAGRKFSASNLQEIKSAHTALGNLLSQVEMEGEEEEMNADDVAKSIEEALEPIKKQLTELEKDEDPKKKDEKKVEEEKEAEKEAEKLKKAITDAVQPLADRIEAIEKSRGISKQDETSETETQVNKSIWSGLL